MDRLNSEDQEFKDFMEHWDFLLCLDDPMLKFRGEEDKITVTREIERQIWNYKKSQTLLEFDYEETSLTSLIIFL